MKPTMIVWDLETVPDLAGFAAANDLMGKSDVEVREAIGDKFPKHIYHSIVCIGALIALRARPGTSRHRTSGRRQLSGHQSHYTPRGQCSWRRSTGAHLIPS
jgi:hypothetical protein